MKSWSESHSKIRIKNNMKATTKRRFFLIGPNAIHYQVTLKH